MSGAVVSADAQHQALRGAIVTLTGPSLPLGRSSITNDDGRFVIDRLPAGRYSLVATKPAYLTTAFGALRPARAGVSLLISDGQQVTDLSIAMPHGAAITGLVRELGGHPATGAQVTVIRLRRSGPTETAAMESAVLTDDRGIFRAFGLTPGDYLVAAEPGGGGTGTIGMMTSAEVDAVFAALKQQGGSTSPNRPQTSLVVPPVRRTYGVAPTYFPGVSSAALASRVTLAVGEERAGLDFTLALVPIATLTGTVVSPSGVLPRLQFIVNSDAVETLSMSAFYNRPRVTAPGSDGTFTVANVAPGKYSIVVRTTAAAPPVTGAASQASTESAVLFAAADVTVNGDDVRGLTLALQPAPRLTGKVVVDQAALKPQPDFTKVVLNLTDAARGQPANGPAIGGAFPVRSDGSLDATGLVPATYRITGTLPGGSDLWMRSLVVAGKDVLDGGLDVRVGVELSGAVLTLSDRHSSLMGTLRVPADQIPTAYFIVVYPSDRTMWQPRARRIRMVRPGTDGKFSTVDLPAGEYYMAALTDVEPDDLADPAFLDALVSASAKITIADGETKVQDLQISSRR